MRSEIQTKFDSYPENVRVTLLKVRDLIYETARKEGIDEIEETLKWENQVTFQRWEVLSA